MLVQSFWKILRNSISEFSYDSLDSTEVKNKQVRRLFVI